jgi:hypothetical protein
MGRDDERWLDLNAPTLGASQFDALACGLIGHGGADEFLERVASTN